jgi:alpha-tubulin suppressor-like RCC1 family protein
VLSFGWNEYGQNGLGTALGTTLTATPILPTNLVGKTIMQIDAGAYYSLLLANDGTVFSFGWNNHGMTGLNTAIDNTLIATAIDLNNLSGKTVTQVSAGGGRDGRHSLLLTDDGSVFSFGWNDAGRTGQNTDSGNTLVATPIDASNLAGKTITQVAAGAQHSLLLASDGTVFSFGSNDSGRTGLNNASGFTMIATPIRTNNLAGKTITQVAAGGRHSLLLADDGTVFSFGYNGDGQTGLNTSNGSTLVARPINTTNLVGKTITQIAAGTWHNLLLADDGTVFSFGFNDAGQTGLNTASGNTLVATPIDTTNLGGKRITKVSAGGGHSLLLAEDGTVFSFGSNGVGQTGLNYTSGVTLIATPIDTTNLVGSYARVIDISAGGYHNLVLAVPEPTTALLLVLTSPALLATRRKTLANIHF